MPAVPEMIVNEKQNGLQLDIPEEVYGNKIVSANVFTDNSSEIDTRVFLRVCLSSTVDLCRATSLACPRRATLSIRIEFVSSTSIVNKIEPLLFVSKCRAGVAR